MNPTEQLIVDFLAKHPLSSSKEIHEAMPLAIGYATIKRLLKRLRDANYVAIEGQGKATKYSISLTYTITKPLDLNEYFEKEIDDREILDSFNFHLVPHILPKVDLFTRDELEKLENLQHRYTQNIKQLSESQYQRVRATSH